jgi:hypothetical protein
MKYFKCFENYNNPIKKIYQFFTLEESVQLLTTYRLEKETYAYTNQSFWDNKNDLILRFTYDLEKLIEYGYVKDYDTKNKVYILNHLKFKEEQNLRFFDLVLIADVDIFLFKDDPIKTKRTFTFSNMEWLFVFETFIRHFSSFWSSQAGIDKEVRFIKTKKSENIDRKYLSFNEKSLYSDYVFLLRDKVNNIKQKNIKLEIVE